MCDDSPMIKILGDKQTELRFADMKEYVKAPVLVDAVQQDKEFSVNVSWQDTPLTTDAGGWLVSDDESSWPVAEDIFAATYKQVGDKYIKLASVHAKAMNQDFVVTTLEGSAKGKAGDYLVQGPAGEAWPIQKAVFEKNYSLK